MRLLFALLPFLLSGAAYGGSFNASIYIKLTSPDGSVYETKTRRILAAGAEEDLLGGNWGVALSFHELENDQYRVKVRVLEKAKVGNGQRWVAYTATSSEGHLGAPLESEFTEESLRLESALFVSAK